MTSVNRLSNIGEPSWTPTRKPESPSAGALLLTLLGEFVLPLGGAAWTGTFVEGLGRLGVEEAAARQALSRSAARGLLVAERMGRRTRWRLTPRADTVLREGAARIYSFGASDGGWDGRWLLVLTSVPEHNRHLRAGLRARMGWNGFGPLGPGMWVSPWADREPLARAALEELDLLSGSISWVGRPGALGDVEARVAEIWGLAALASEYEDFARDAAGRRAEDDGEAFTALAGLVHDWRHFPAVDPGLPATLLPPSWPAPAAAAVFARRRAEWRPAAHRWWAARDGT